jgi:Ger(x)C family germination protein
MKMPLIIGMKTCIIFSSLFLTGCWDMTEADQIAYVTALGIDKDEDNEGKLNVTYVLSNPEVGNQAIGDGGAGDEPPQEIISFTANDFITSRSLVNTVIPREVSYNLLRVIIVSEAFARDSQFIRWMYDVAKSMEIRRDIIFFVSKEDPVSFVQNNQPKMDTRPHKYYELIFQRGQDTGITPPSRLVEFFRIMEGDADLFLGTYGTTIEKEDKKSIEDQDQIEAGEFQFEGHTNETQFAGSAVFKEGKMIDTLTIEETSLAYLLSNDMNQPGEILTTFTDPFNEEYQIAARIFREGNIQLDMDLDKENPSIQGTVPIRMSILTNHSMIDFQNNESSRKRLKSSMEDELNNKIADLIEKTQEEFGSEPFGWSLAARKEFLRIPEFEAFDWMKTYPDMDINIEVELDFENFGRQTELPDLEEMRD